MVRSPSAATVFCLIVKIERALSVQCDLLTKVCECDEYRLIPPLECDAFRLNHPKRPEINRVTSP